MLLTTQTGVTLNIKISALLPSEHARPHARQHHNALPIAQLMPTSNQLNDERCHAKTCRINKDATKISFFAQRTAMMAAGSGSSYSVQGQSPK
jgi:hypothetical protein